jgi:hypothetical protein
VVSLIAKDYVGTAAITTGSRFGDSDFMAGAQIGWAAAENIRGNVDRDLLDLSIAPQQRQTSISLFGAPAS